jgi:hypothetical protein
VSLSINIHTKRRNSRNYNLAYSEVHDKKGLNFLWSILLDCVALDGAMTGE